MTKLSSSLPKTHGLGPAARRLVNGDPVVALVVLRRQRRVEDYEKGETELVAKISEIEVIQRADLYLAEQLMRRALEARTGQPTLPYDLEEALKGIFEGVDLQVPFPLDDAPEAQQPLPEGDPEDAPEPADGHPEPETSPVLFCDSCGRPVERDDLNLWFNSEVGYTCPNATGHSVNGER